MAAKVAIMQGTNISVAFLAPAPARIAMIDTGIRVSPEACRQRNMICALEALSLLGLSSCKLSMALMPKGVAALSRPIRLAEKFITMWPVAGWSFGTSGKMREKNGEMIFATRDGSKGHNPMHTEYQTTVIRELRDQQVRFAPPSRRLDQLSKAEQLLSDAEPSP